MQSEQERLFGEAILASHKLWAKVGEVIFVPSEAGLQQRRRTKDELKATKEWRAFHSKRKQILNTAKIEVTTVTVLNGKRARMQVIVRLGRNTLTRHLRFVNGRWMGVPLVMQIAGEYVEYPIGLSDELMKAA